LLQSTGTPARRTGSGKGRECPPQTRIVILTGENPFLRLSEKDGDPNSTDASYWRSTSALVFSESWTEPG